MHAYSNLVGMNSYHFLCLALSDFQRCNTPWLRRGLLRTFLSHRQEQRGYVATVVPLLPCPHWKVSIENFIRSPGQFALHVRLFAMFAELSLFCHRRNTNLTNRVYLTSMNCNLLRSNTLCADEMVSTIYRDGVCVIENPCSSSIYRTKGCLRCSYYCR